MVSTLIVSSSSKFNVRTDFYFILIEIKIKFQYYVYCIFHLLEFEYALFFILSSLKVRVFFSKDNGAFSPLKPLRIFFMIIFYYLSTHERDLSLGLQSSLDIHTSAFNFCHLAGGTVTSLGCQDTLQRYRQGALLSQELPRSRELHLERQHVTTPVTISVLLSVHRSLSPPTDHSRGYGKSLFL